jgi:hypothetical protein
MSMQFTFVSKEADMSDLNGELGTRKLRVTVTVEQELDSPKSTRTPSSKESWASVRSFLKKRIINFGLESSRRLFWWLL